MEAGVEEVEEGLFKSVPLSFPSHFSNLYFILKVSFSGDVFILVNGTRVAGGSLPPGSSSLLQTPFLDSSLANAHP